MGIARSLDIEGKLLKVFSHPDQIKISFYPHSLRHEGTIVTASEGGVVSYWKYPDPHTFDPIDEQVRASV